MNHGGSFYDLSLAPRAEDPLAPSQRSRSENQDVQSAGPPRSYLPAPLQSPTLPFPAPRVPGRRPLPQDQE
ncbi:hypothetical protein BD413DRAFT_513859 [Trametes elegans]|nr:hypothetical protein BD413DRAFT_513859 [Trametes elegans]